MSGIRTDVRRHGKDVFASDTYRNTQSTVRPWSVTRIVYRFAGRASARVQPKVTVGSSLSLRSAAFALISWLAIACSGAPEVVNPGDQFGMAGNSGASSATGSGGGDQVDTGNGGGQTIDTSDGNNCKKTCDSGECGPVANGCGGILKCGGCKAPETCGGSGVPSHCGEPELTEPPPCEPKTCTDLGASCGLEADGCGAVLDCWGKDAIKVDGKSHCSDPAATCVAGECKSLSSCTAKTCANYTDPTGLCGPVSDGCGGTLDCGFSCASGEVCGVDEPGKCGTAKCEPINCEAALADKPQGYCGYLADGCGGQIANCATTCTGTDTCGGGGTPDVCGHGSTVVCVPKTQADCGPSCGPISDGCSGSVDCGGCTAPKTCGGGVVPGQCGAPVCQPKTCQSVGANCGSMPDGCGGTLICGGAGGACGSNQVCNTNQCQDVVCKPKTAGEVCTGLCGTQSDGCSGTVNCGGCTAPNTCGGSGTPSVCGVPPCVKTTCQAQGATCGPIGDGCGGIIASCGTCSSPDICGGGGTPSACGHPTGGGPACTGLCQSQVACTAGQETRLTGVVTAPNGTEPLYNALVYVPNAPLPAIASGASCVRCQDEDLGSPIAAALTGADGAFVLKNIPAGVSFPLVVKMGKWRRVVTISAVPQCTNLDLTVNQTRLPRNMTDATTANVPYLSIPKTAMVTGDVDGLECVLRKIGVSDSEFTLPTGTGRIHMYRANGGNMCSAWNTNGTCKTLVNAPLDSLFANNKVNNYDLSIFGCEGGATEHNNYDAALRTFANNGGRVFASHFAYTYLHDNGNFKDTATWGNTGSDTTTTGIIDKTSPKGGAFNSWLGNVGAFSPKYGNGYMDIQEPRYYAKSVLGTSERFVYTDTSVKLGVPATQIDKQNSVQEYAFNTPVGADANNVCGRVLYSGFHVAGVTGAGTKAFPSYCSTGPLTAQEKVLEFMIFDLSACVSVGAPPPPATCTPKTCTAIGANCGPVADGCGGILDCGGCTAPQTCGGGGTANKCGSNCKQTTCGAKGANCGTIADGCGGTLDCGSCPSPAACGGGGTSNVCGVPQCQPLSCSAAHAECGPIADGCGSTINCGSCTTGTCGGGGTPNVCGSGSCAPRTCQSVGASCGLIGDGCGGTISCGTCQTNSVCGAGGPNVCGKTCAPRTCSQAGADCGFVGDGCGGVLDCGTCSSPLICGGGGVASKCGGACSPRTCAQAGAACGAIADGCGSILQCGSCPTGSSCGGGGTANQCGGGACTPRTCTAAGADCGSVGDGCGGILSCGTCAAPQSCGGAGVANKCGAGNGGCVPLTCAQQNANCGPVADGCGGLLDCGTCASGTCGGAGTPSQCGTVG